MLADAEAESEKFPVVAPFHHCVVYRPTFSFCGEAKYTECQKFLMSEIDCVLNLIEVTHNCGYVNFFVLRPAVSLTNTMVIKRVLRGYS